MDLYMNLLVCYEFAHMVYYCQCLLAHMMFVIYTKDFQMSLLNNRNHRVYKQRKLLQLCKILLILLAQK